MDNSNSLRLSWPRWLELILATAEQELGCPECFDELDGYVDLLMAGANPDELMPLVRQHLQHCPDCLDQFEALVLMVRSATEGSGD